MSLFFVPPICEICNHKSVCAVFLERGIIMKFLEKTEIENNVITYRLKAAYNDPLTSDEEQEIETLHDYIRKIKFSDIDFTADVDMSTGMPIVAPSGGGDDSGLVRVSVGAVSPREYVIDDNLDIEFSIDVSRIFDNEIGGAISSKSLFSIF